MSWTYVGLMCMGCGLLLSCAGGERRAESPDSAEAAEAAAPERAHALDVDMSFGGDEDAEAEQKERYGYVPPPTRTYSPSRKMSADEKPE